MFNLIKNEFIKILKKKSFYIVTIIFILYAILTNFIYKEMNNINFFNEESISSLEEENKELDLSNEDDLNIYVDNLASIDEINYTNKTNNNSSKYLISEYIHPLLVDKYTSIYIDKNISLTDEYDSKIANYLEIINKGDWTYFPKLEIDNLNNALKEETNSLNQERITNFIKLKQYRLDNNIDYDLNNYLNNALNTIETDLYEYMNLTHMTNLKKEEQNRLNYLKKEMVINKYILENKVDLLNDHNLAAVLKNFSTEFGLFILIYIIMISSSIVSEEFNKGTIKNLLTKPYKRSSIILAKFITVILFIPLIMLFLSIMEILIGGLMLGFNSIKVPVIIYDTIHNSLKTYNIFSYLGLNLLSTLPIYLVLGFASIMLSTFTLSTSASSTITFLIYLVGNIIANLALTFNFKIFKAFVSLHWDFSYLVNLNSNPYQIKPIISLGVVLVYLIVICFTTTIILGSE